MNLQMSRLNLNLSLNFYLMGEFGDRLLVTIDTT